MTFTFELERLEPRLRPFEKLIRIALQDGAKRTVRKLKLLIEKEMLDERLAHTAFLGDSLQIRVAGDCSCS
ncbi:MAG: hypothetical protein MZW92_81455 [Comamonadaceae bacterium]|nr:hypothetical protein [Comamonadaceae bacterium]